LGIQGIYFVVLARGLGAVSLGAAAALLALASMMLPFSSLGSVLLLVKNVARRPADVATQWANALALTIFSGVPLIALMVIGAGWMLPVSLPVWVVVAVGLADLVFAQVVEAARSVFLAKEHMTRSAYFPVLVQVSRLVTVLLLVLGPWKLTPGSWALSYLAASIPVAILLATATYRHTGWAMPRLSHFAREWKTGAMFMIGMSSATVYNDMDKAMLARLSTLEATGIYSAAYRVVDLSYAPVRSLLSAASPGMWRAGSDGVASVVDVVRRQLLRSVAAYCLAATALMFALAGLVPLVLGPSFSDSVPALRALSFLLILKGCHYLAADTLTCAGRQSARTVAHVLIAAANVALCLVLIPRFNWQGATLASLLSDGSLAVALTWLLWRAVRRERAAASSRA